MSDHFVLIGKEVVRFDVGDGTRWGFDPEKLVAWARMFDQPNRRIATTKFGRHIRVSTIFLGLDHSFFSSTPVLFETMVFSGKRKDVYCDRCSTYEQAERQHKIICAAVKALRQKQKRLSYGTMGAAVVAAYIAAKETDDDKRSGQPEPHGSGDAGAAGGGSEAAG